MRIIINVYIIYVTTIILFITPHLLFAPNDPSDKVLYANPEFNTIPNIMFYKNYDKCDGLISTQSISSSLRYTNNIKEAKISYPHIIILIIKAIKLSTANKEFLIIPTSDISAYIIGPRVLPNINSFIDPLTHQLDEIIDLLEYSIDRYKNLNDFDRHFYAYYLKDFVLNKLELNPGYLSSNRKRFIETKNIILYKSAEYNDLYSSRVPSSCSLDIYLRQFVNLDIEIYIWFSRNKRYKYIDRIIFQLSVKGENLRLIEEIFKIRCEELEPARNIMENFNEDKIIFRHVAFGFSLLATICIFLFIGIKSVSK